MMNLCMISTVLAIATARTYGWSKATFSSKTPKVSGQSVGSLDDGSDTILFGGLTGAAGSPCTDETWELDAEKQWKMLEMEKQKMKPRVRMYSASAVLDNKLVLFGGWDPGAPGSGGEFLDDIWEFDFSTKEWSLVEDTKLPFPVSRHTACTVRGVDSIILHTYKGILVFKDGKLSEQSTKGDAPDGLSMCAVAPLTDSKMLLFGGSTRTQQMSRNAYVLDTDTWTWTKLSVTNKDEECPPSLASACAATVSDNKVIIFGGASIGSTGYEGGMGLTPRDDTWLLDATSDGEAYWTKVESKEKPGGRVAASLSPTGDSSFLLQGGYDPLTKTTFDEPWIINL